MELPGKLVEAYEAVVQVLQDRITTLKVSEAALGLEEVTPIVKSCRREQEDGKVGWRGSRLLVRIDKEHPEAESPSMRGDDLRNDL
ncbi:MAG: hypothetical protein ABSG92_08335 [Conexivisphaerales archaeon]